MRNWFLPLSMTLRAVQALRAACPLLSGNCREDAVVSMSLTMCSLNDFAE
ncbi:MAG: hypothetical protein K6G32_12075 [Prevotella sp.]|nr:hypothetical protein [Prevotella sp.]